MKNWVERAVDVARGRAAKTPPRPRAPVIQTARTVLERPACPLCGATRGHTRAIAEDAWIELDQSAGVSAFQEFSIVRCEVCSARYTSPRFKKEWRRLSYPSSFPFFTRAVAARTGHLESPVALEAARRHFFPRAARLTEVHPRPGRILDLGMGDGLFLDVMRARGWEVVGADSEESVVWFARERLGIRAAHVLDIEDDPLPEGPFDVVSLWGTIQLVYQPHRLLARIRDVLAPGGLLVIGVFNAKSAAQRVFGDRGQGFGLPRQLVHYTPETLRRLVDWAGYQVVRTAFSSPSWLTLATRGGSAAARVDAGRGGRARLRPGTATRAAAELVVQAASPLIGWTRLGETVEIYARRA